MSLLGDEVVAVASVATLGILVLGWRTWAPGLGDAEHDRQLEDDAREFFDSHGRWPDKEPPNAPDRRPRDISEEPR